MGFVGRNGAGKTTTMRIVCGLLSADGGTVTWQGGPIDGKRREGIGYMPEERGLYPKMRIADQLEYFAVLHGASHERARAAARSWLDRLGLADRVVARVDALSHGNQQRVQLAAALVHGPDLLILDEPFAGLDPIATDVMVGVLREQAARGVPVLFSSHQLELVEHVCDAVAIVDHGRLVACGRIDELRRVPCPRRKTTISRHFASEVFTFGLLQVLVVPLGGSFTALAADLHGGGGQRSRRLDRGVPIPRSARRLVVRAFRVLW